MNNLLHDYTFQVVSLGSMILGALSGALGTYAILRKQSLLGDGLSHSALPGVILAFIISNTKKTEILLLGAIIAGLLANHLISIITTSKVKFDSALAIIMSSFFGFGMVLLTLIQRRPSTSQAGLSRFIFGQASTIIKEDIISMSCISIILLFIILLFWKEFKIVIFDRDFSHSIGFNTTLLDSLLSLMLVVTIMLGLQSVGVILMSTMLIAPASAAKLWCKNLSSMMTLSAIFGAISGLIGTLISSSIRNVPTGPTIVVISSIIFIISLIFSPNEGIIITLLNRRKTKQIVNGGHYERTS